MTPPSRKTHQQLLDEQAVVQDHNLGRHQLLLVYEVRIGNGCKTLFVAVRQHTSQFTPSCGHSTRNDQRCIPEVDETDFTTFYDSPAMT